MIDINFGDVVNGKKTSDEEVYFSWFLNELEANGIIYDVSHQPESFCLFEGFKNTYQYEHKFKRKRSEIREKEETILNTKLYTPDFKWKWARLFHGLLYSVVNNKEKLSTLFNAQIINEEAVQYAEIKGLASKFKSHQEFVLLQKWAWQKTGIFVQKIIVPEIFGLSFTPKQYFLTNKSKVVRATKFKKLTIEEFLNIIL